MNITNAEPITFRGVNMAMQHSEIVGLLKRKKFKCEVDIYYANCYVNESKKIYSTHIIRIVNRGSENDKIEFGCETYRGCPYSVDEVISSVSKFTGVRLNDVEVFDGWNGNELGRCGRGNDGDKICVMEDKAVVIFRGSLGAAGLSMD